MPVGRPIQISVDVLEPVAPNQWRVGGRCYLGPIRLGDTFTAIFEFIGDIQDDTAYTKQVIRRGLLHMEVKTITAYGYSLDQLDMGVSAALLLEGTGGDQLKLKLVLGEEFHQSD